MHRSPALALSAAALALVAPVRDARACGGMIFPNHSERAGGMSEQEVLVVFGEDETVLLASAGYKDAGQGAAFLLPVKAAPTVEEADLQIFAGLDDATAPQIDIYTDDGDSRGGGLCGGLPGSDGKGGGEFGDEGQILVLDRGTTASYEYVVVGGDTGTAVEDWLTGAGYTLPDSYAAALEPYVAGGWYFFAAKVKPGVADGALPPVELHLPRIEVEAFEIPFGLAAQSLPPDGDLTITTYLLAPGGVTPANYTTTTIDPDALVATSETSSNYAELYAEAVGGEAWVIDASVADYSADRVVQDLEVAISEGRLTGDSDGATAFAQRVPFTGYRLTRLRTTLPASELRDLRLQKTAGGDVSRRYSVRYATTGCRVGGRPVPGFVLLLPVLLLLRRRR
jgi:hypothetical protein